MTSTAELTSPASANTPGLGTLDLDYTLDHKYTRTDGRIYLSGVQALVRLPLMQQLRDAAAVLFDEATPDAEVRAVIFETVGRDLLKTAYDRVGALAEPPDDVYFAELRKHRGQFRFAPALLLRGSTSVCCCGHDEKNMHRARKGRDKRVIVGLLRTWSSSPQ